MKTLSQKNIATEMSVKFISRANKIHKNKYDYSQIIYVNSRTKVEIICPYHGSFWITPKCHVQRRSCKQCWLDSLKDNRDTIISKFKKIHGNRYNYDKIAYSDRNSKINITCSVHGLFQQTPIMHLRGHGCSKCANDERQGIKQPRINIVTAAMRVHAGIYEYGNIQRTGNRSFIEVKCPLHGWFKQDVSMHISGRGCKKCGINRASSKTRYNTDQFIFKARTVHNKLFDYSQVQYKNCKTLVIIVCPIHGPFKQMPSEHLRGSGCLSCSIVVSSGHKLLSSMLPDSVERTFNNRSVIGPYEIDIWVPEFNLGIEHHGYYWHSYNSKESHSQRYAHYKKHDISRSAGIKLIQIFDFELNNDRIIKSMLAHYCGKSTKVHARTCEYEVLTPNNSRVFFDANHIQKHRPASFYAGLVRDDIIYCAISLSKIGDRYEIIRFANLCGHSVTGGFSKLLSHSKRNINSDKIMTYADRRFSNGMLYSQNNFVLDKITKPGYKYISSNGKIILSRQKCQKHKLLKLLGEKFDPFQSESENMFNCGYRRIWDAGHYKYITL